MSKTNSMNSMMCMASFVKSASAVQDKHQQDTWAFIWKILFWSFMALWSGFHPVLDWDNKPFQAGTLMDRVKGQALVSGGFRFFVFNILGDLEFYANVLRMPHWQSHALCWRCDAHRVTPGKDWKMLWGGAKGWVCRDPATYAFPSPHTIFLLPGVTSWCICLDMLHCMDNHGICSNLAGSSLHYMVYNDLQRGHSADDALAVLVRRIMELYEEMDVKERFSKIFLSMICNVDKPRGDWATLKGKGAETRHLIPVLHRLCQEHVDLHGETDVKKSMVLALKAASQFYELCEAQPMFMSPQASRKALALMETLLKQYSIFHTKTSENGQWYCNIVPKCHHSWHMADAARFMNPRHCWTYKCESWVGKISTIAASCAHGTRSSALTPSLAAKYRVMVCVNLWRIVYDE